jgi:hypothetical protein
VETCRLDSRDKRPHAMQESSFGERCGASNAAEDSHPLGAEEAGAVLLSLSSPSKPVKMVREQVPYLGLPSSLLRISAIG